MLKTLPIHPPAFHVEDVVTDLLKPWSQKGITEECLKNTYSRLNANFRSKIGFYEVFENQLYVFGNTNVPLARKVNEILKESVLPNIRFIYYNAPGVDFNFGGYQVAPILCQCANTSIADQNAVPFLDRMTTFSNYRYINEQINAQEVKWSKKMEQLIWRGGPYSVARSIFKKIADLAPHLIDAQFTTPVEKAHYMSLGEQLKYKYQLIISGVQGTFPGIYWRLLSGSLSFWHAPQIHRTWYSKYLQENVHFVRIADDFSDLFEKIAWAKSHDALSQDIAIRAKNFISTDLSVEKIKAFAQSFFKRYAALQRFSITSPSSGFSLATEEYLSKL